MAVKNNDAVATFEDDAELYALDRLLSTPEDDMTITEANKGIGSDQVPSPKKDNIPYLRNDRSFEEAFSYDIDIPESIRKKVESVSAEDLDLSDEEQVTNYLERKYNEYGIDIDRNLKEQAEIEREIEVERNTAKFLNQINDVEVEGINDGDTSNKIKEKPRTSTSFKSAPPPIARNDIVNGKKDNDKGNNSCVYTDPVFGLRIVNPMISSTLLVDRMSGRKAIPFSSIAFHTQRGDLSKDWVIAGVLVNKGPIKMTKKGDPFSIWRLSDLKGEIKMASLFLFKSAHKELWKTTTGTCIAVLNASIFEKRAESGDVACLSIDTSQKVMILGQSKDMGVCKSKKKNGEPCTAIINSGDCDYCVYHMKQEFGKMSRRSELQSCTAGRGLNELRNKVLGKSEVFYGGQLFSAVPAKKSSKLMAKDKQRMMTLSEYAVSPYAANVNHTSNAKKSADAIVPYASRDGPVSRMPASIDTTRKQRVKDLERLKALQGEMIVSNEKETISKDNTLAKDVKTTSLSSVAPRLSRESFSFEVDITDRQAQLAKIRAMNVLKQKPLEKVNPNSLRGSNSGKKRAIDELNERFSNESKRHKTDKDKEHKSRIQRIMEATSSHTNLIDSRQKEEMDKYFKKLHQKETLEEKMLNTYKVPCKAVICQRCKYTSFSAAERCKTEGHPLKVVDAEKRFFQCKDCSNRTVTVFKLPKISCNNCKSSRWERVAMIRERKIDQPIEKLSIRGDEEKFMGSLSAKSNLNLLVPEE